MSESEAIKYFRLATDEAGHEEFSDVYKEMCGIAIQALTEVQAYRAIGTAEEFKAIKQWKADIIESFSKYDVNSVDELMKRFKELTEKAEPKKPIEKMGVCYLLSKDGTREHEIIQECPNCHSIALKYSYPCRCGQLLDWQ